MNDDRLNELGRQLRESHDQATESIRRRAGKMRVVSPKPDEAKARRLMIRLAKLINRVAETWEELEVAVTGGTPFILGTREDDVLHDELQDLLPGLTNSDSEIRKELDEDFGGETTAEYIVRSIQCHYHGRELCENRDDRFVVLYEAPESALLKSKSEEEE